MVLKNTGFRGVGGFRGLTMWGLAVFGWGAAFAAPVAPSAGLTPRETVRHVDSLVRAGAGEQARPFCTGQALRLLPLLIDAEAVISPFLDANRSFDTILEEKRSGNRSALRVKSVAFFRIPFMGHDSLSTIQAIHLVRDDGIWKISDLEELASERAPLVLRQGAPAEAPRGGARGNNAADPNPAAASRAGPESFLPLSPLAPSQDDRPRVTRLRLRVSLRDSAPLTLPTGRTGQRVIPRAPSASAAGAGSSAGVVVETIRPVVIDSLYIPPWDDSLEAYRASTTELDLTDKALRTRAAKLKQGSPHHLETTRRIHNFVSTSFDYKLGATLFATSREALRTMKGDCSEAAVLTAALLRAAGIPSRVMLGYASLGRGVWIGHAWAEAWLGGTWIGVDAALGEFPAGPHRVALLALSGREDMKAAATNLMLSTLSNLDIEITGAWAGDTPIALVKHPAAAAEAARFWEQVMEGMGR